MCLLPYRVGQAVLQPPASLIRQPHCHASGRCQSVQTLQLQLFQLPPERSLLLRVQQMGLPALLQELQGCQPPERCWRRSGAHQPASCKSKLRQLQLAVGQRPRQGESAGWRPAGVLLAHCLPLRFGKEALWRPMALHSRQGGVSNGRHPAAELGAPPSLLAQLSHQQHAPVVWRPGIALAGPSPHRVAPPPEASLS